MGFTMRKNQIFLTLSVTALLSLTACGDGDADDNVERTLFAVGDIFEGKEDGDPVTGDVSRNDLGDGLSFAVPEGAAMANGVLEFNSDGTFVYTANPDFSGEDSITYTVTQEGTGETDSAQLTFLIESDFETLAEYGWNLVWADEFDGEALNDSVWAGENTSMADGQLAIAAQQDMPSSLKTIAGISSGRVEASIMVPEGTDVMAVFGLMPINDMYDGYNALTALKSHGNGFIAGAHYGLGLTSGVEFNGDSVSAAKEDFQNYAIEWDESQIRWYINGVHVHTVNPLNTWAYNMAGDDVVVDNDGPFNQELQVVLKLDAAAESDAQLLVDYVKVWSCDPSVEASVENCASNVKSAISKAASDRIESVETVVTEIFNDGFYDKKDVKVSDLEALTWHHTDVVTELSIGNFNSPTIEMVETEGEHNLVIDVSHPEGDANIGILTPGVELVGHNAVLSFDLYIDSANTTTETLDIRMETGWPYMGMFVWNVADLALDTWVTYEIPVSDFVASPFLAPDWLTWIPGVGEGDPLPLDTANIGALLVIEFHGGVHFQLDNVQVSCVSNESCFQAPLAEQEVESTGPAGIRYEAENWDAAGDVATEDTQDEDGGQNVGWIDAGDFLEYTITAPGDGTYYVDYRLASQGGSDGFEFSIDGVVVDTQEVADTGGWQNWATQSSAEFDLTAGEHIARFDFVGGAININWFELFAPPFEILVEAENWQAAGDVATEDTADEGGGQNVGWIDGGDFLEYTVNIPADGTYFITYRLASQGGSDGFETSIGGVVVDTQEVADTGGWQNWVSQTAAVDLVAGEQTLRLDFVGGAINLNWIKITN
ncbi:carbohydrate-binding protein [Thalassotalea sp. HSM 43]|nr:carbohydrate-binding protein [Thalassotalea sp. HSM 43]